MIETRKRSIAKALSWRVFAGFVTIFIVWVATGETTMAATVGVADTLVKLGAFYAHERAWQRIEFGRVRPPEYYI